MSDRCPTCGAIRPSCFDRRVPVERLREGDRVQAVEGGPIGTVLDADQRGWTIVKWPRDTLPYEHGRRHLMLQ